MIRIGLGQQQKQKLITKYLNDNQINKIYCFYYKKFPYKYKVGDVEIEYIEYSDIEMYKYFYRLLEEIDSKSLIIIDELMRTQNRSELIYNCSHHYLNQTAHKIIFEYFPIIEDKEDFMILLNFEDKDRFHEKGFDYAYLHTEDVKIYPRRIKMSSINIETSENELKEYKREKEKLFTNLGNKHPDTIPRNLQLFAGNCKKKAIEDGKFYVARNKRFALDNVVPYKDVSKRKDYVVVDFHHKRVNFNDFLKFTGITKIEYLRTSLPVDTVLANDFVKWKARVDAFYAQANIYE